jgi:hypothetical protein
VQPPALTMCTIAPPTVQVVGVCVLKVTARPDEAVALTAKSALPYVLFDSAPNVIVCVAPVAVTLSVCSGAAL